MSDWTEEKIAEQLAVCEAATEGPWVGVADRGVIIANGDWSEPEDRVFETGCGCCTARILSEEDAAFIVAARTDYPSALREILALRRALEMAFEE